MITIVRRTRNEYLENRLFEFVFLEKNKRSMRENFMFQQLGKDVYQRLDNIVVSQDVLK